MRKAPIWRAWLAPLPLVLLIPACAPTSEISPPARTDATIYVAEDGRALLPLRLSSQGWAALEAADPAAARDIDRMNLVAICVAGLGMVDADRREALCGG